MKQMIFNLKTFLFSFLIFCVLFFPNRFLFADEVLTLQKAVILGIKQNPEVLSAQIEKIKENYEKKEVFSQFLPQLYVSYSYEREDEGKNAPAYDLYSLGPSISWNIFNGLQSWYSYKEAEYLVKTQDLRVKKTILELSLQITRAYLDYFKQLALKNAAEKSLKEAELALELARERYKQGLSPFADVLDAEAKVKNAKFEVSKYSYTAQISKATLLTLINYDISKIDEIKLVPPSANFFKLPSLKKCFSIALKNRPEVKIAEYQVLAQQEKVKAVKGKFLPSVDVFLSYQKLSNEFRVIPNDNYQFSAGIKVTFPLFLGGERYYELQKSRLSLLQKRLEKRQTILEVEKEVFSAYQNLQKASYGYKSALSWFKKMQEDYEVALSKYKAGLISIVDLTTVLARLSEARAELVNSKFDLMQAYYELEKSIGIIPGLSHG